MIRSPSTSPVAERMRRLRQRRRQRLRPIRIVVHVQEIDALAKLGYLEANERNNSRAIARAVNDFISEKLLMS